MKSFKRSTIAVSVALALCAGIAHAELVRVGPNNPAVGNFPEWVMDYNGVTLDFCLPKDATDLANGNCLILPADVPNPAALPETFAPGDGTGNFAGEHFFYALDGGAALPVGPDGRAGKLTIVIAAEAAFAAELPIQGDQAMFGRIRFFLTNLPVTGTYVIEHPYGVVRVDGVAGDVIRYTDDVGINCQFPNFTCMLETGIGPFLRPARAPGGQPDPFVRINGSLMLADPAANNFVTGSPYGRNSVRVTVEPAAGGAPQQLAFVDQFTVMGRVREAATPADAKVDRATYQRNSSATGPVSAQASVFASGRSNGTFDPFVPGSTAPPAPAFEVINLGAGGVPMAADCSTTPFTPRPGKGQAPFPPAPVGPAERPIYTCSFFAQVEAQDPINLPAAVTLRNATDSPPSIVSGALVDDVAVLLSEFDPGSNTLAVKAESLDKHAPPALAVVGVPGCTPAGTGTLDCSASLAVPQTRITVASDKGGAGSADLRVLKKAIAPTAPVANDDTMSGSEDAVITGNLAANDTFPAGSTFQVVTPPAGGSVSIDATGVATYTPTTPNFNGTTSFSYLIRNPAGVTSSTATVTLAIAPVNDRPLAAPDAATTVVGVTTKIFVLNNDSDVDGDALSIVLGATPAGAVVGVGTDPVSGKQYIEFTATTGGLFNFNYQASDGALLSEPATAVSVNVAAAETLLVQQNFYRLTQRRWIVGGTSSVLAGQDIQIRLRRGNGTTVPFTYRDIDGTLQIVQVDGAGAWVLDIRGSTTAPLSGEVFEIKSLLTGATVTAPISVRN